MMPLVLAGPLLITCTAARASELDFSAWRTLPVFDRGRRMPLESFANVMVREICGRSDPTFDPSDVLRRAPEGSAARAACKTLFPDGAPRRFTASELLFSWIAEPELWEHVPFLAARHEGLRSDLLGVPLRSKNGSRFRHVSPAQLIRAEAFRRHLGGLSEAQAQARREGREFSLVGLDRHVNQLYQAYALYRLLTYNPAADVDVDTNRRFGDKLIAAHNLWADAAPQAGPGGAGSPEALVEAHQQVRGAFVPLGGLVRAPTFTITEADPLIVSFREACERFARLAEEHREEAFRVLEEGDRRRAVAQQQAANARTMAETAEQLHRALYDVGRALRLVPGLDPEALRADRDVGDGRQPWLSVQALLLGSDALLEGLPRPELDAMREAFAEVGSAYVDRRHPRRPERFAEAMQQFASAVRALGEAVEPHRRALDIPGDDEDRQRLLAETAYPPRGYNRAELHYNRVQPFLWSWVVCLVATVAAAMSFAFLKRWMFWVSVVVLTLAQAVIVYGLTLRTYITGYTAVTNMFETVVFVAFTVALFGVWFTLLPLLWPGIVAAWRWTAMPPAVRAAFAAAWRTIGAGGRIGRPVGFAAGYERAPYRLADARRPAPSDSARPATPPDVARLQWCLLPLQLAMMAGLFVVMTLLPWGSGGRPILRLLPDVVSGQIFPTMSDLMAWSTGLAVLVLTLWLTPRVLLTAAFATVAIPAQWRRDGVSGAMDEAFSRRVFVLVGAAVGLLAGIIAYQAPVLNRDIEALQPILRDNFWLTVHVLVITASYGAGALAWGQSNIALGYYLFGRYRNRSSDTGRRPPEICSWLAGFTYRSMQVAVLLLTVGTILGALWADVAWGRFWSWDAKEVWSLISILGYMLILHGRYIGWFGDFGLAAGSVFGLTLILMTWYGVNYVFGSGLHSYGGGAGGQYEIGIGIALNWLFVAAAAGRYRMESRRNGTGPSGDR